MYFNREDYGSRIRSLRKKRGLTQEQLAEKMNVSTPYIAKIETGKQTGPVELAVEFAAFFEVSLDYLLVGKGDFAEEQKRGLPPSAISFKTRDMPEIPSSKSTMQLTHCLAAHSPSARPKSTCPQPLGCSRGR